MIIEQIISQHAEESAFLWLLRDDAVKAPHYNLDDLNTLEKRIEAHLDGLRIAGENAWPFCEEGLSQKEAGEVFAAGYTALDNTRDDWLTQTLDVVAVEPETTRGLVSALGWVPREKLQGHVVSWLKSDNPLHQRIGLSACAIQRVDCGAYLKQAIENEESQVRARALRSVSEIHRYDLTSKVITHLQDDNEQCRFWAAWSATLLGETGGLATLRTMVDASETYRDTALALALRAMEKNSAMQWVRDLNNNPAYERSVIQAAGAIGDPASVPWLISKMENSEMARIAGEAFSMIIGADLAYDDLDGDWPEGFEAGPNDDPEDENVDMDSDEDLPWPNPELLNAWWSQHKGDYPTGERLLCGRPITEENCIHVLKYGYQRQRRAAALELALLRPGQPLFNTSATARQQARLLGLS